MDWWIDPEEYNSNGSSDKDIAWNQKVCYHEWKATILIISVVYDCIKCGVKKEEYEKWKKQS